MTQAPNSSQNHGVIIPMGVGFSPDDQEIIQLFLKPTIKKKKIQGCLIEAGDLYPIISGEAGPWDIKRYPYFQKNHYWLFVKREPVRRGSTFIAQRRVVGPEGNLLGTWKSKPSTIIKKVNIVLGFKQKLEFMTKDGLNSGWYQSEYTRYSTSFEKTAVSHLVYDKEKDEVAHANFQRQHENQENAGKKGFDFIGYSAKRYKISHLAREIKTETNIKIGTGALADESKIKVEMDALADESKIKIETCALANESKIKIETCALVNESKIKIETGVLVDESKIKTETGTLAG